MSNQRLFAEAAESFIRVVSLVDREQWSDRGLGEWDVRALVGHTCRALLTVENYLDVEDPGAVSMATAERYYATIYSEYTDPDAIAQRGVEAGAWLGDSPLDQITAARDRVMAILDEQESDRRVSIGGLGIPLTEYLRTRTFELVMHTIDIADAIGVPSEISPELQRHTLALAAGIAVETDRGEQLLRGLTGRGALPAEFSVV